MAQPAPVPGASTWTGRINRLIASPRFQAVMARLPVFSRMTRAEGEAMFGLIQGFVQSQALLALVELRVLHKMFDAPVSPAQIAGECGLSENRMALLMQAGAGMGLLRRRRDGRYGLSPRGAAFLGVPGLEAMVRHHSVLYRDLTDPVAFLRGETEPGLAKFWPYVFGAEGAADPEVVETYSNLMADSQAIVADDTLAMVDLRPVRHLMDVGGGTGAFLTAVGRKHPHLKMTLFDLPVVVEGATARFTEAGLMDRVTIVPGSFRDDALPEGPDAISLVRVLFDHADATVEALLARVFAALPPGGRVIVSEAMGGGDRPIPATDVYFAFYCAAMQTGRVRSGAEIAGHLSRAGFVEVKPRRGFRPYVTSIVTARKPGNLPAA